MLDPSDLLGYREGKSRFYMAWARPIYEKVEERTAYNRAGKVLLKSGDATPLVLDHALELVNNWRASHRYPLHVITMMLRQRALTVDANSIAVSRSKRLASIVPKLERMRLTQIQDIGGCRAIVKDIASLRALHKFYEERADPRRHAMEGGPDDYVLCPKKDGYRGIHYVFRYRSDIRKFQCWNDMKIEIQIRTKAQHMWATVLEIVDSFTGQDLKTDIDKNKADPDWKLFFQLMGSVIALREKSRTVPGVASTMKEIGPALKAVATRLNAILKLDGYGTAVKPANP